MMTRTTTQQPKDLPENYMCHFSKSLDSDLNWAVTVYRYYSLILLEMIDFVVSANNQRHYSDNTLRTKSFVFKDGDKVNYTSQATIKLNAGSN